MESNRVRIWIDSSGGKYTPSPVVNVSLERIWNKFAIWLWIDLIECHSCFTNIYDSLRQSEKNSDKSTLMRKLDIAIRRTDKDSYASTSGSGRQIILRLGTSRLWRFYSKINSVAYIESITDLLLSQFYCAEHYKFIIRVLNSWFKVLNCRISR